MSARQRYRCESGAGIDDPPLGIPRWLGESHTMPARLHGYAAATREDLIAALRSSVPIGATGIDARQVGAPHRAALLLGPGDELAVVRRRAIEAIATAGTRGSVSVDGAVFYHDRRSRPASARTVCVFPGFGVQHTSLLPDLVARSEAVEHWLDDLGPRLHAGRADFGDTPSTTERPHSSQTLDAVLLSDVAVWQWLRRLGFSPDALVGHSFGEFAMLLASGVVSDYAALVRTLEAIDAAATQARPRAEKVGMVAVSAASRRVLERFLRAEPARVFLALDNCPQQTVVWGDADGLDALVAAVETERQVAFRLPALGQPVHTPLFPLSRDALRATWRDVRVQAPTVPSWSAATLEPFPGDVEELRNLLAEQWHRPVRFRELVERLHRDGADTFVEVGAGARLSGFVRDSLRGRGVTTIPTNIEGRESAPQLLTAAAQLFVRGLIADFSRLDWREPRPAEVTSIELANPDAPAQDDQQRPVAFGADVIIQLEDLVAAHVASVAEMSDAAVDRDRGFFDLGLTSLDCVTLLERVASATGLPLPQTLVFDHPTVRGLATAAAALRRGAAGAGESVAPLPGPDRPARESTRGLDLDVAAIGMGCRFPGGADTPEAFWLALVEGRDAVGTYPSGRWAADLDALLREAGPAAQHGAFLDGITDFDAAFFGISPREALTLDPQQRLLLEVVWEALEHAAIDPRALAGSRTGVFIGISNSDYAARLDVRERLEIGGYLGTGTAASTAAGRLSYVFGFQGPALSLDTACSSSLAAVHLARESLLRGECDVAIAGGVNLIVNPETTIYLSRARALSPTGRCHTFDAAADGYVRGEGCGIVVLKRLADAARAGDHVYGLVRGSAMNHDGRTSGLTVPNGLAQEAVIRTALASAGCEPSDIGYVETHGTGTPLGDPIEVQALARVFASERTVRLGAVKTNIGHLEAAAGIAGLIKVLLQVSHQRFVPSLHMHSPNPRVTWPALSAAVVTRSTAWAPSAGPCAGVSAFGISGTNVHVVVAPAMLHVEEPEGGASRPPAAHSRAHVFPLSARSPRALSTWAGRLAAAVAADPDIDLASVSRALTTGRAHHACRAAFVAGDRRSLLDGLQHIATGEAPAHIVGAATRPRVAFLFTGQGAQVATMGCELRTLESVFARAFEACCAAFDRELGLCQGTSLAEVMADAGSPRIDDTGYAQPALFAFEYAMTTLWKHWGVAPGAAIGHSLGEIVAACVSDVLSLDMAVGLVSARARAMRALPAGGAMLAVNAPLRRVEAAIASRADVSVAADNAHDRVVVSGAEAAVRQLAAELESAGIRSTPLVVSHAFHSALMEPALASFGRAVAHVTPALGRTPIYSNETGAKADASFGTADYWVRHMRHPVRFADGIRAMVRDGIDIGLEVGPRGVLTALAAREPAGRAVQWLASVRGPSGEHAHVLSTLASLYERGAPIDWQAFAGDNPGPRAVLPRYAFERQRFWIDSRSGDRAPAPVEMAEAREGPIVVVRPVEEAQHSPWPARVAAAPAERRRSVIQDYVCRVVCAVLGLPHDQRVDEESPLVNAGFDSLMALQVSIAVGRELGVQFEPDDVTAEASVASLAEIVHARLDVGQSGVKIGRPPSEGTPPDIRAVGDTSSSGRSTHRSSGRLSYGQQALWFLWKLAPTSSAYHQSVPFRVRGADLPRWRLAAEHVVRKHAMLRTTIRSHGRTLVQDVSADPRVVWTQHDARTVSATAHDELLSEIHARPFDLGSEPPIRFQWIALPGEDAILLVTMHHIGCDAWSLELLRRDLSDAVGGTLDVSVPRHTYVEFAEMQRTSLEGEAGGVLLEFWRAHLSGVPRLDLPLDRPRPALQTFRGASVEVPMPSSVAARVRECAARFGVTPFLLWFSAYAAVLARWSRQRDVVIGTPSSGRTDARYADVVGYFADPVVVRMPVDLEVGFEGLVRSIQPVVKAALAHAVPFPLLVEKLQTTRDPSRSPVFDVSFNFHSRRALHRRTSDGASEAEAFPMPQGAGKFDLTLTVIESQEGVGAELGYNADLFDSATIARVATWLPTILEAALADSRLRLADIELECRPVEATPVLQGRKTDVNALRPVHQQILEAAARHPERLAVVACDGSLTYGELETRSSILAQALNVAGARRDTCVALSTERTTHFVVALVATLRAGAAYVPLDHTLPETLRDELCRDVGARLAIREGRIEGLAEGDNVPVPAAGEVGLGDLAYVIFTSGSTGKPKGVGVEHRALANYVESIVHDLGIEPGARFCTVSTFAADLGHTMIFPSLATGGTLYVLDEVAATDRRRFAAFVREQEIDYLKIVPSHLAALVDEAHPTLPRRALVLGGESSSTRWIETLKQSSSCQVFNHYGPTETTVGVLTYAVPATGALKGEVLPLDRAIANVSVWLLDESCRPVPPGVPGEVYISGPCLARGYMNDEPRTRSQFANLPGIGRAYRTGDLARQLSEGGIVLMGRIDRQVKVRGHRVEPSAVEARLRECPVIAHAIVLPTERHPPVMSLTAFIVPAAWPPPPGLVDAARQWLDARVPPAMVPSRFIAIERPAVTSNGKLDLAKLYEIAETQRQVETPPSAMPRDVVEWTLERIWKNVLGVSRAQLADNFFHEGGHSLLAVQLVNLVETELGVSLPVATLFMHPTLEGLARVIRESSSISDFDRVLVRVRGGAADHPPLICFPGAGGSPLYFRPLIEALDVECPIWAGQAPITDRFRESPCTVQAQAEIYVEAIAAAVDRGTSVQLAGHSFGALVAYEVAHGLRARGICTTWIGVIDNRMPAHGEGGADGEGAVTVSRDDRAWIAHIALRLERLYGLDLGPDGPARETCDGLAQALFAAGVLPQGMPASAFTGYVELYKAHAMAANAYRPTAGALDVPITLLRASAQDAALDGTETTDPTLGWSTCTTAPVDVEWVGGTHITMLMPPHAAGLAARIAAAMARAAQHRKQEEYA